jgi:hypothetical protein
MGSRTADEMPASEVAKVLGVDIRTLQGMVRRGLLQPVAKHKVVTASTLFRADEIAAFADVRFKKLDLGFVASMAMRAYVISTANAKRIDRISDLLGLDLPALETDETSVVRLYIEAQDFELEEKIPTSLEEIRRWAATLFSIDESYLRLIEHYTGNPEPWQPFFDLVQRITETAPPRSMIRRRDVEAGYAYLEAARRHFRGVMYFFYRSKHGQRAADRAFPEMDDRGIDAELAAILYPS